MVCRRCNEHKHTRVQAIDPVSQQLAPLFNPRKQSWPFHFTWSEEGTLIIGLTPVGRATVLALNMNDSTIVEARLHWVEAGWHPPED
ncbi:MAG: hypothetical protein GY796_18845 [Chloroflexi bacterium]|nr:hypothetical protein [Chloroflexota bacterium]